MDLLFCYFSLASPLNHDSSKQQCDHQETKRERKNFSNFSFDWIGPRTGGAASAIKGGGRTHKSVNASVSIKENFCQLIYRGELLHRRCDIDLLLPPPPPSSHARNLWQSIMVFKRRSSTERKQAAQTKSERQKILRIEGQKFFSCLPPQPPLSRMAHSSIVLGNVLYFFACCHYKSGRFFMCKVSLFVW